MKTEKTVTTGSLTSEIISGLVHMAEERKHLHVSCDPTKCDFLFNLQKAKDWLKMHEQISVHEQACSICKNNGYGVATQ